MSSFTAPLLIMAVPQGRSGGVNLCPPGASTQRWMIIGGFTYAVGSLEQPSEVIEVPDRFIFDGATVPVLLRAITPTVHPDYIQAAALHDWMLQSGRARADCDAVFTEALQVLNMPAPWRQIMVAAVRLRSMQANILNKIRAIIK